MGSGHLTRQQIRDELDRCQADHAEYDRQERYFTME
jgi:hypothetical protein